MQANLENVGLAVQACGDAHLANFGIFGSPERLLVFDVNDFDETTPGPWEWDVKRLATSMEVAARGNGFAIAAYLGSSDVFDQAITQFAAAYADQNERDHQALVDAITSGRLTAERDT